MCIRDRRRCKQADEEGERPVNAPACGHVKPPVFPERAGAFCAGRAQEPSCYLPVPIVSASFCISSAAAFGSRVPLVIFSSVPLSAVASSLHVEIAGCALVSLSCWPNNATSVSYTHLTLPTI